MNKKELLKKYYDRACYNLLCYSKTYGMSEPKEGFELEWQQANDECITLKTMMNEYVDMEYDNNEISFIGYISSTECSYSKTNQEHFIERLEVYDCDDNRRLYNIDYEVGKDLLKRYDIERHERYDLNKSIIVLFKIIGTTIKSWKWIQE